MRALLTLLLLSMPGRAAVPDQVFDSLRDLRGRWSLQAEGQTLAIEMTYEAGSHDSIVTERFGKELSVFHRDGSRLLMTHFCNAGNQPRLELTSASTSERFEFVTCELVNGAQDTDAHVARMVYERTGHDRVDLQIHWRKGPLEQVERYSLFRLNPPR